MTSINHDCPNCGTSGASFLLVSNYQSQVERYFWFALVECGVCKEIALTKLVDHENKNNISSTLPPIKYGEGNRISSRYFIATFEPKVSEPLIPESIPENVLVPLTEAEKSFAIGLFSAAGSCYRKAIERAVKHINPSVSGMLNKRIREIEKDGLLPHAMIDLLDQVRIFGNSSMHEDDVDPTKEDCIAARDFCQLFLNYAFTLPARIEKAKIANSPPASA